MKEVNLSVPFLMRQVKILMQQYLHISEDLECANERISVLEKELQMHNSVSQRKHVIYDMKILSADTKGV